MKAEYTEDYIWVMEQLQALYDELGISYPDVLLTDCQAALINACGIIFPLAEHMLCIWHIENNITTNCRKHFDDDEAWESFKNDWYKVMYATTEQEFNHEWDVLQQDYTADFPFVMIYLADNLIPRKRKFVSFWTN